MVTTALQAPTDGEVMVPPAPKVALADALFCSGLLTGEPYIGLAEALMIAQAMAAMLTPAECVARVAYNYGEFPFATPRRMRYCLVLADHVVEAMPEEAATLAALFPRVPAAA